VHSFFRTALSWLRGDGVDSRTGQRRWVIVVLGLMLPIFTYLNLVEFAKGRRIDRENVRVAATVLDVVEYHSTGRSGRECDVRVLASFPQEETGNIFFLGDRTGEEKGQHYVIVQGCSAIPRVSVGDTVPVEYAAGDPRLNRLYSDTSAVGANLSPLVVFLLWLLFGGLVLADRLGNKLFDW
jgi:uncharacterized protein DUF3592